MHTKNCWKLLPFTFQFTDFLCALAKLQKATIGFIVSVQPFHWTDFDQNWYLYVFRKSVPKIQVSLTPGKNNECLHEDSTFMTTSCWIILRMGNILDRNCGKIKTHTLYSITFFRKSCHFRDNGEKYCIPREATLQYGALALHAG